MKKLSLVLTSLLVALCLVACNKSSSQSIEGISWELSVIQSGQEDGSIVAYNPSAIITSSDVYPDAVSVDMSLTASGGNFSLADISNDKTYEGTYKVLDSKQDSVIYEITMDGYSGNAVVSMSSYHDGSEVPTLIVSIDNYTLNFQAPTTD